MQKAGSGETYRFSTDGQEDESKIFASPAVDAPLDTFM